MAYRRKDHFYKRAKKEGYLSRAAYKLEELNRKMRLVKKGDRVVDVGCAPGGWSQVLLKMVGSGGLVIGIDILDRCQVVGENFRFLNMDVEDGACVDEVLKLAGGKVDVVVSDAAPNTTGIRMTDHARSVRLVGLVISFALEVLKEGGNFAAKVFDGPDTGELVGVLRENFSQVRRVRPGATRKESSELYLTGIGFKGRQKSEE